MRGKGVAWWHRCDCRSRTAMLALALALVLMILSVEVESTRVRVTVAAIESPSSVEVVAAAAADAEFQGSVEMNGSPGTTTWTRARSWKGREHVHSVWDVEAESPPAQRQRDRSLWGMSKRLVPTGPNPLHN